MIPELNAIMGPTGSGKTRLVLISQLTQMLIYVLFD